MSLTYCLGDKDSELSQFFEATFPTRGDLLTRYRLFTPRRGCTVSWTWSMIANAGA